jgi:hypothetical protein
MSDGYRAFFVSFIGKSVFVVFFLQIFVICSFAGNISDKTYLIALVNSQNCNNQSFWDAIQNNNESGLEIEVTLKSGNIYLKNSNEKFSEILKKINKLIHTDASKTLPVFVHFGNNVTLLDSIINASEIASSLFFLPQDEAWPTEEYLIQANRRVIFFVDGNFTGTSRILHPVANYALSISATENQAVAFANQQSGKVNQELMVVENFEKLNTKIPGSVSVNLEPDYINFLLENWKKFGKRPNFVFVGTEILYLNFITSQLNSFTWIKGTIKYAGKNLEKVYWNNPEIQVTGGTFSFPYRGGEELILSPFAPGFQMVPEQIIVTGEMTVPESYQIMANPVHLSKNLTGSFIFDNQILNSVNQLQTFEGNNFSYVQDIKRGNVLRLPENASINLGKPENYGLRNSSFTVSCFVKFTEILEFGDNAILGNYERGYRKGLHLILRSGHPYFGLWANDFVSKETLEPNIWYHLTWRYVIETGEQSIFLNGRYIGGSDGHPPFSGTGDIHLGSALSSGASLRGYIDNLYIWSRPLGNEEINRLSLDETVQPEIPESNSPAISKTLFIFLLLIVFVAAAIIFYTLYKKKKKTNIHDLPAKVNATEEVNRIELFGEFKAVDKEGTDITELFTPKVKELLLFTLIGTLKSGIGAGIQEINETLWFGIDGDKVANNRSVTLNKLRKLLLRFEGIEIVSNGGYLQAKIRKPFYCDFFDAYKLCQIPEGLTKPQLISFFEMVRRGRFMKGTHWPWLDEIRGYTGNQVIDILLNLAVIYQKENNLTGIEKIAQRILDYDDLNEEAIYLQIWALQKANNQNLAKFSFNSFVKKYEANMGEPYRLNYQQFSQHFENGFK